MEKLQILFGSVICLLLALIVLFVWQLHADFKKVGKELEEAKAATTWINRVFKGSYQILNQRVYLIERRVKLLESKISNKHH